MGVRVDGYEGVRVDGYEGVRVDGYEGVRVDGCEGALALALATPNESACPQDLGG
jgi:hypothetical protein